MCERQAGLLALAVLAVGAGILFAVSVGPVVSEGLGLVAPPQLVSADDRRLFVHKRAINHCINDLGGRAMFDSASTFIGCDRTPDQRIVRQADLVLYGRRVNEQREHARVATTRPAD